MTKRIGDILLEFTIVEPEQLADAVAEQGRTGELTRTKRMLNALIQAVRSGSGARAPADAP